MSWDEGASDLPRQEWPTGPSWKWPEADRLRMRAAIADAAKPLQAVMSDIQAAESAQS